MLSMLDKRDAPLRKITSRRQYRTDSHPHGTYSVTLLLECGHEAYYKGSQEPRFRARCGRCKEEGTK